MNTPLETVKPLYKQNTFTVFVCIVRAGLSTLQALYRP
jgi:hypothetical protein